MSDEMNFMTNDIVTTILTQYHVSKGLKIYGQDGIDAVLKEMKQIHDRMVIDPKNPEEMTREEKSAALKYMMFLKQKKNGTIKGRGCADGRSQRASIDKSSVSAPTVAT